MKVIVYSCSVGAYDKPRKRLFPEAAASEYLLFTDNSEHAVAPWTACPMPPRNELTYRRWSRAVKLRPHLFLPPHDISIYMDYSFEGFRPFVQFLVGCLGDADLAVHKHKHRDCAYQEAARCAELGLERQHILQNQILDMMEKGFPPGFGLGENGIFVRRNNVTAQEFNEYWWREYMLGGQRDQVSMPVALWQSGAKLNWIPGSVKENGYYRPTYHAKDRRVILPSRRG